MEQEISQIEIEIEGEETPPEQVYWADDTPEKLIQHLENQRKTWIDQSVSSGIFAGYISAYWRNTIAYNSNILEASNWTTSLQFGGKMGELIKMKVPKAKTRIGQFVTLVTRQRYSYEALTDVTDANPQITAKLAKNIAKSAHRKNQLDIGLQEAAETTATVGMSFLVTTWRKDLGGDHMVDPETKQMIRAGEAEITIEDISTVTWDWTQKDWRQVQHAGVRMKRNRWDLVAQYKDKPDLVKKIIDLPSAESEATQWKNLTYITGTQNEDMVWVNYWYHRQTPALPNGRMFVYAGTDCWFEDEDNSYDGLPIEPVIFDKIKDTTLGYPLLSNLLPAQEMLDQAFSTQATNQSVYGLGAMANPRGSKVSVEDIGGLKMFNYTRENAEGGGKPEPIQFPDTPVSVMNFAQALDREIDDMAGLNETIRGQSASNVTSGQMAATLSANSLEFMNKAQSAIVIALENTMNHVTRAYQKFATVEQTIEITGESTMEYVKMFKAEDLAGLRRITIRTQSAMLNSQAGRIQLGETLTQQGLIKDAQKLILLYEGAPIEVLFEGTWNEEICVQAEIDALLEGQEIFPLESDNHPLYIAAYKKILDNPFIRSRTQLPQMIIPLMKQRIGMEMSGDPYLKAMLRGQPLPEQAPPQGGGSPQPQQTQMQDQAGQVAQPAQPAQPAEPVPMQ